jgi:hypothetical protein
MESLGVALGIDIFTALGIDIFTALGIDIFTTSGPPNEDGINAVYVFEQ